MKKITIAIDGFSSCGKSTMAKDLAKEIGYIYIDSGAMYRAVTLYSIENGLIDNQEIKTDELKRRMNDIHISFSLNPDTQQPETMLNGRNVETLIRDMKVSSFVSPIATLISYAQRWLSNNVNRHTIGSLSNDDSILGNDRSKRTATVYAIF